eukprot:2299417-Rhodomonas_salina.1
MLSKITELPRRSMNVTRSPPMAVNPYFSNQSSNREWNADGACRNPYKLRNNLAVLPGGGA